MAKVLHYATIALAIAATTVATVFVGFSWKQSGTTKLTSQAVLAKAPTNISALGRLEPQAEVTQISAPMTLEKDRVAELWVKPGDRVKAGQVVAVLDSYDRFQLALIETQEQVNIAQSRLAQVQTGAKTGEIQAQEATITKLKAELIGETATQSATIDRWQAEVNNALTEYQRFQELHQKGAITTADLARKQLDLATNQAQLEEAVANQQRTSNTLQAQISEAEATLSRIAEVRPVDLNLAQMEVNRAIALQKRAENDLQQTYVRAPMAGQILKIHARLGEKLSDAGIAEIGQTQQMVAVAEVYQTDITKVRIGQAAIVTGSAFAGELQGTVYEVGLQVNRQSSFSTQPGENLDRRVIEVKIRLNPKDSQQVSSLTNLQVQVAIVM
jgi:HlyD family secretion protein